MKTDLSDASCIVPPNLSAFANASILEPEQSCLEGLVEEPGESQATHRSLPAISGTAPSAASAATPAASLPHSPHLTLTAISPPDFSQRRVVQKGPAPEEEATEEDLRKALQMVLVPPAAPSKREESHAASSSHGGQRLKSRRGGSDLEDAGATTEPHQRPGPGSSSSHAAASTARGHHDEPTAAHGHREEPALRPGTARSSREEPAGRPGTAGHSSRQSSRPEGTARSGGAREPPREDAPAVRQVLLKPNIVGALSVPGHEEPSRPSRLAAPGSSSEMNGAETRQRPRSAARVGLGRPAAYRAAPAAAQIPSGQVSPPPDGTDGKLGPTWRRTQSTDDAVWIPEPGIRSRQVSDSISARSGARTPPGARHGHKPPEAVSPGPASSRQAPSRGRGGSDKEFLASHSPARGG